MLAIQLYSVCIPAINLTKARKSVALVSPMNSTDDRALRDEFESFLKNHPRLFGVLFAALMLLSETGAAAGIATYSGP